MGTTLSIRNFVLLAAILVAAILGSAMPALAACTSPQTASIASGGTAQFTCSPDWGDGPTTLNPSHGSLTRGNFFVLTYTNNGDGSTSDVFRVEDENGTEIEYQITIAPPTSSIVVSPASLPTPAISVAYSQTLTASGGAAPYTFTHNTGSIPPGLTLAPSGLVSGTPTGSGSYAFTVQVTDNLGATVLKSYSFIIPAPTLSMSAAVPNAGTGQAYSHQLTGSGGTAPYSFLLETGSLPPGITLNSAGLLSGNSPTPGDYNFTVRLGDSTTISTGGIHFILASRTLTVGAAAPSAPTIGTAVAGTGQATVTFAAPSNNGGAAISAYTATATPGGFTGSVAGPAAAPITVSGLSNGTSYTFTVTATNAAGTSPASAASNAVTPKAAQTIIFTNPGAQNFGTAPTLTATATSGLAPVFTSSTTGVCTISPAGLLTFNTSGVCTIDADQGGDGTFAAAPTVSQSFAINAITPGAPIIGTAIPGDAQANVTFAAPASAGGAAITGYTVTSNPGGLTGTGAASPVNIAGLTNGVSYTFTVTANNSAGTGPASAASNAVTPAAAQTITFNNPGAQSFGTTPTLTATASSGLTPIFTSSTNGVCMITPGGLLSFVTAGTCTIDADQAGDSSYLPAGQVSQSFSVIATVPGAPTIGAAGSGDTQASVAFVAPAYTGGAAITGYTITSNPGGVTGTGAGSPILVMGLTNGVAYTFTATATNSAGTGAASAASNSITPAAGQTITFNNPGAQNFGTTPILSATSDSGLTPVFTSSTPEVCTITPPGALTFVSVGTCTVNADQPGDGSYLPAVRVSQTFAVNAVVPGAPTGVVATGGTGQASVAFVAPTFTGGSAITGYTVVSSPAGFTGSGATSPIVVAGLTSGVSYSFTVTATNASGSGAASAASNTIVPGLLQTINFANPGPQTLGSSPTLAATASSGLPVAFSSTSGAVCTITGGGALTLLTVGTCDIVADQAGDGTFAPAAAVTQSFSVVPTTIVLTPAGDALPGGMAGEAYSQVIASSGHGGGLAYALTAGALPPDLVLNAATGEIAGFLTAAATGDYAFDVTASDATGGTATASLTLRVTARAVTAQNQVVTVPPGATPVPVNLAQGATGGPFTEAVIASLVPPYAGTAKITMGDIAAAGPAPATSFYLKFTPNPQFGGTAVVSFQLVSALGVSNVATVSFITSVDIAGVEEVFEDLTLGFVESRADLLAGAVNAPGLQDRRGMGIASSPGVISMTPNGNSMTMNFATSTLSMAAFQAMDSLIAEPVNSSGVNFWIDGTATLHVRSDSGTDHWGSFALLSAGADVLVNDKLLVGLALHADWMEDLTGVSRIAGNGILAGPYVSAELGDGVFLDASLLYGHSWNDVSTDLFSGTFGTGRLLARVGLEGEWILSDVLSFRPSAKVFYLREDAESYTVSDGGGLVANVDGFVLEQFRASTGGTLQYTLDMGDGVTVRPFVGLQLGLSLTDGVAGSFATLSTGFDLLGLGQWTLGGSADTNINSGGLKSISAKARIGLSF